MGCFTLLYCYVIFFLSFSWGFVVIGSPFAKENAKKAMQAIGATPALAGVAMGTTGAGAIMSGDPQVTEALRKRRAKKRRDAPTRVVGS